MARTQGLLALGSAALILALATALARVPWIWEGRLGFRLPVLLLVFAIAAYEATRGLLHLRRARLEDAREAHPGAAEGIPHATRPSRMQK